MNINKKFLLIFFLAVFTYAFYINTTLVNAAASNCPCVAYELYSCPNNPGCKVVYDKNGKPLNKCGYGTCMRCKTYKCPEEPRCTPRTLDCSNACGKPRSCISDGCGGQSCCAATAPCLPTVPPACVDSDGGSAPNVAGKVTISAPALPQVLNDSCMVLKTTQNGSATTTQWIIQATGTHVGEKTCTNTTTGAYADSVIACANGCIDGACSTVVNPCPKRPQGDANCDQSINDADFIVIKSAMKGLKYAALNHSADFNNNGKVDLVDYEIWRNTVKQ